MTRNDLYLITVQLTFRFGRFLALPPRTTEAYFTVTRFRHNSSLLIAKNSFMVPAPSQGSKGFLHKQPHTLVRSDLLQNGDRLCVTVSRPDLIYASKIDNFFGIISL